MTGENIQELSVSKSEIIRDSHKLTMMLQEKPEVGTIFFVSKACVEALSTDDPQAKYARQFADDHTLNETNYTIWKQSKFKGKHLFLVFDEAGQDFSLNRDLTIPFKEIRDTQKEQINLYYQFDDKEILPYFKAFLSQYSSQLDYTLDYIIGTDLVDHHEAGKNYRIGYLGAFTTTQANIQNHDESPRIAEALSNQIDLLTSPDTLFRFGFSINTGGHWIALKIAREEEKGPIQATWSNSTGAPIHPDAKKLVKNALDKFNVAHNLSIAIEETDPFKDTWLQSHSYECGDYSNENLVAMLTGQHSFTANPNREILRIQNSNLISRIDPSYIARQGKIKRAVEELLTNEDLKELKRHFIHEKSKTPPLSSDQIIQSFEHGNDGKLKAFVDSTINLLTDSANPNAFDPVKTQELDSLFRDKGKTLVTTYDAHARFHQMVSEHYKKLRMELKNDIDAYYDIEEDSTHFESFYCSRVATMFDITSSTAQKLGLEKDEEELFDEGIFYDTTPLSKEAIEQSLAHVEQDVREQIKLFAAIYKANPDLSTKVQSLLFEVDSELVKHLIKGKHANNSATYREILDSFKSSSEENAAAIQASAEDLKQLLSNTETLKNFTTLFEVYSEDTRKNYVQNMRLREMISSTYENAEKTLSSIGGADLANLFQALYLDALTDELSISSEEVESLFDKSDDSDLFDIKADVNAHDDAIGIAIDIRTCAEGILEKVRNGAGQFYFNKAIALALKIKMPNLRHSSIQAAEEQKKIDINAPHLLHDDATLRDIRFIDSIRDLEAKYKIGLNPLFPTITTTTPLLEAYSIFLDTNIGIPKENQNDALRQNIENGINDAAEQAKKFYEEYLPKAKLELQQRVANIKSFLSKDKYFDNQSESFKSSFFGALPIKAAAFLRTTYGDQVTKKLTDASKLEALSFTELQALNKAYDQSCASLQHEVSEIGQDFEALQNTIEDIFQETLPTSLDESQAVFCQQALGTALRLLLNQQNYDKDIGVLLELFVNEELSLDELITSFLPNNLPPPKISDADRLYLAGAILTQLRYSEADTTKAEAYLKTLEPVLEALVQKNYKDPYPKGPYMGLNFEGYYDEQTGEIVIVKIHKPSPLSQDIKDAVNAGERVAISKVGAQSIQEVINTALGTATLAQPEKDKLCNTTCVGLIHGANLNDKNISLTYKIGNKQASTSQFNRQQCNGTMHTKYDSGKVYQRDALREAISYEKSSAGLDPKTHKALDDLEKVYINQQERAKGTNIEIDSKNFKGSLKTAQGKLDKYADLSEEAKKAVKAVRKTLKEKYNLKNYSENTKKEAEVDDSPATSASTSKTPSPTPSPSISRTSSASSFASQQDGKGKGYC